MKTLSAAALAISLALTLTPGAAHARFGKSDSGNGNSNNSSNNNNGSNSGSSGNNNSSSNHSHSASSVPRNNNSGGGGHHSGGGSPQYNGNYTGYGNGYGSGRAYYSPRPNRFGCWANPYCYGYGYGYAPFVGYYAPGYFVNPTPQSQVNQQQQVPPQYAPQPEATTLTLGADAQLYRGGGGGIGANLGFEKNRWGFSGQFTGIFVPTDDGSAGMDGIQIVNAHLTYALLSGEHGRLRLGLGVDTAFAPDLIMVGPGGSINVALGVLGPMGLEGNVTFTPYPFLQLDWSAGATLALGPIGVRGGWRSITLGDNGAADGVAHTDVFSGPYVALAITM